MAIFKNQCFHVSEESGQYHASKLLEQGLEAGDVACPKHKLP